MNVIPSNFLEEFNKVACLNRSKEDGKLIETLAFVAGYIENDMKIATHLIFPDQESTPWRVNDKGKFIKSS